MRVWACLRVEGSTDVLTGTAFVEQLAELGKKMGS